jgi:hypothetical protein
MTTGLVACGGSGADPSGSTNARATDSTKGLTIETQGASHIAGRFEKDGVAVGFDLTLTGGVNHAVVRRADGSPFIDSTLKQGIETTELLGGRATVSGALGDKKPIITGDEKAVDELKGMPETKVAGELRGALLDKGVDHLLVRPVTARASVTPQYTTPLDFGWYQICGTPPDGTLYSYYFVSWSWWGWSTIMWENGPSPGTVCGWGVEAWAADKCVRVDPYNNGQFSVQWWGSQVEVTYGPDDGVSCALVTNY